jgi:hypothetical protein
METTHPLATPRPRARRLAKADTLAVGGYEGLRS